MHSVRWRPQLKLQGGAKGGAKGRRKARGAGPMVVFYSGHGGVQIACCQWAGVRVPSKPVSAVAAAGMACRRDLLNSALSFMFKILSMLLHASALHNMKAHGRGLRVGLRIVHSKS